jgi:hypothetical protein
VTNLGTTAWREDADAGMVVVAWSSPWLSSPEYIERVTREFERAFGNFPESLSPGLARLIDNVSSQAQRLGQETADSVPVSRAISSSRRASRVCMVDRGKP